MSQYTVRPLSDRTWLRPASKRKPSRFSSSWSETEQLLSTEVEHLRGRDLVIEVDVSATDFRLNGTLRTRARAATPAVVIAFDSKHGPMLHRCDTFVTAYYEQGEDWQQNVRAIALTLQVLRAMDRYGAVDTGQQYQGFKALPAGRAMPASHMTADEAWSIIGSYQNTPIAQFRLHHSLDELSAAYRRARAANHPDRRDGDRALWDKVEQAARVLDLS